MLDAAKRLLQFIEGPPKTSQGAVAALIGASQSSVSAWVGGRKRPGLRLALELEKLTGIKASSWTRPRAASRKAA